MPSNQDPSILPIKLLEGEGPCLHHGALQHGTNTPAICGIVLSQRTPTVTLQTILIVAKVGFKLRELFVTRSSRSYYCAKRLPPNAILHQIHKKNALVKSNHLNAILRTLVRCTALTLTGQNKICDVVV